jgi:hypothetical protein
VEYRNREQQGTTLSEGKAPIRQYVEHHVQFLLFVLLPEKVLVVLRIGFYKGEAQDVPIPERLCAV